MARALLWTPPMHPSLEPYVDPPSLINGRYILVGVVTGLTAFCIAFAVLCHGVGSAGPDGVRDRADDIRSDR